MAGKKIVIAGALGYIGSALIDLYRDATDIEVLLVDRLFVPDRLANLPGHFRFIQSDIFDPSSIMDHVRNADILYLLVAEVEAESSKDRETSVWRNNFEACCNLVKTVDKKTRVVFTSSGNLFGGLKPGDNFENLTEKDTPCPKLPYAESKYAMESFLRKQHPNHTIARLGTNFGYAPGVRFNLVTNIFTQRMLMGRPILLHGGGKNFRPSVHVRDAAAALKFIADRNDTIGEVYHVARHNLQICQLAERIAKYNPACRLEVVDKVVPFNSYQLSSDKLKSLGFNFAWDLEKGIEEMSRIFGVCQSTSPAIR